MSTTYVVNIYAINNVCLIVTIAKAFLPRMLVYLRVIVIILEPSLMHDSFFIGYCISYKFEKGLVCLVVSSLVGATRPRQPH